MKLRFLTTANHRPIDITTPLLAYYSRSTGTISVYTEDGQPVLIVDEGGAPQEYYLGETLNPEKYRGAIQGLFAKATGITCFQLKTLLKRPGEKMDLFGFRVTPIV